MSVNNFYETVNIVYLQASIRERKQLKPLFPVFSQSEQELTSTSKLMSTQKIFNIFC